MSRLRSYAPSFVKKLVWDRKHRTRPIHAESCPADVVEALGNMGPDSVILDLGCGAGNLRAALRLRGWRGHYIGVDVSATAIETARSAGDESAEWYVSPIEDFPLSGRSIDAICFCESIYYVRPGAVPDLLCRCCSTLAQSDSRILVRIWHTDRHLEYVEMLSRLTETDQPPLYAVGRLVPYQSFCCREPCPRITK